MGEDKDSKNKDKEEEEKTDRKRKKMWAFKLKEEKKKPGPEVGPSNAQTRAIIENAASNSKVFFVHFSEGTKKSFIYAPGKKLQDVLQAICLTRKLSMESFEVRKMDGTPMVYTENTLLADLGVMEVKFVDKVTQEEDNSNKTIGSAIKSILNEGLPFSFASRDQKDPNNPTTSIAQGQKSSLINLTNSETKFNKVQRGIHNLIHTWIQFNFFDFDDDLLKERFSAFCKLVQDIEELELLKRLLRYQRAGIRNFEDLQTLVGEIILSDQNKFLKKTVDGEVIVEWLQKHKGLRFKPDCMEICNIMITLGLLKPSKAVENLNTTNNFEITQKYRLHLSRPNFLEEKIRSWKFQTPDKPSNKSIMDFPPLAFAKQLMYYEFMLFKKVRPFEINYWLKGDVTKRQIYAPNLCALTNFVNLMTQWVSTEILKQGLKERQLILKRFINIAKYSYQIKNFDGVLEVVMGLNNGAVKRLKETWNIPKKYLEIFNEMQNIVSPEGNWSHFRKLVEETKEAFVPYIGLYLSDLTFIKDGGGTNLLNGHFGWEKNQKLAKTLEKIQNVQERELEDIIPEEEILQFIGNELFVLPEKELFKISREYEPPVKKVVPIEEANV